MFPLRPFGLSAALLALGAISASAQPVISAKSGTIARVEGKVYLNDKLVEDSLTKFPDIKENGVVRAAEDGRAEILLTPGVVMHLGEKGSFRLITNRLIDTRLELLTGSAVIDAADVAKDTNLTIVCKDASVSVSKAGHYRLDADPARLRVFAGMAAVEVAGQHLEVTAGKLVGLGNDSAAVEKFDKNDTDSLDNWARKRGELMAIANVSSAKSLYNGYASVGGVGLWNWNPYFGMYTWIPGGGGRYCDSYYGYCYYSPNAVNRLFNQPPPTSYGNYGGGGYNAGYGTMAPTSGGYSGAVASSASSVSSAPAAAASASSAASSSAASSAGHGSGGGGGRGH